MRGLVLVLVAMLAATAIWLFARTGSDAPPGGGDLTTAASNSGTGSEPGSDSGTGAVHATGNQPGRTTPQANGTPTRLEVAAIRDPDDIPLADVEIAALALDANGYHAIAATDASGIAAFEVPAETAGATGVHHLTIAAGGGPTQTIALAPGTPRRIDLRLAAQLFVEGHVVSAAGQPIAGEIVFLAPTDDASNPPRVLRIGRARADGTFRVAVFGRGHLGARHPTLAASVMVDIRSLPRDPATGTANVRLALDSPGCKAAGLVVGRSGQPTADVELLLRPTATSASSARWSSCPLRFRTDSMGRFMTAELPPGQIEYEALAADGRCARGTFTSAVDGTTDVRITIAEPAAVAGSVSAVGGTSVVATLEAGQPGDLLWNRATTDDSGKYRLTGLPAGPANLIAVEVAEDSAVARRRATNSVTLEAGELANWNVVFGPRSGGRRLHGLVVDQFKRPLPGSAILVHQHDPPRDVRITTGSDGRFVVPSADGGLFDVFAYAPGRLFAGFPCVCHRDVDADSGMLLVEIDTSREPASIRGIVRSKNGDGVPAQITCWHRQNQQTVRLAAGTDGHFDLADIPPGNVILFFTHPGFVGPPHEVVLGSGEQQDLGLITLAEGSPVHGQITAIDGTSPAAVEISIHVDGDRLVADYNAGTYRFDSVPAGRHRLLIHGTGIAASAHPIEVQAGTEVVQDIRVAPGIPRRIAVTDPLGNGGWVTLALRQPQAPYTCMLGQRLPAQGSAEFLAYMAPGTYEAIAWDDQGRQGRANVTFAAGAAAPTAIELETR